MHERGTRSRDPAAYARRCLTRLRYFLLFDETNPKAASRLYRVASMTWLVLALVGLLSARTHWRRLWPTAAVFALVMLFHTLTIVSTRFRFPLEPFTFVWAAIALMPLVRSEINWSCCQAAPSKPPVDIGQSAAIGGPAKSLPGRDIGGARLAKATSVSK